MTPSVPAVLNGIVQSMVMELAPEVKSAYGTQTVQLGSALLMMIAQEFDRAAARLVEEDRALIALFREAQSVITDKELWQEIDATSHAWDGSLLVSSLRERNKALRAALIRLHAHVETLDDPAARKLDQRLWEELAESVRRRQLDLANG